MKNPSLSNFVHNYSNFSPILGNKNKILEYLLQDLLTILPVLEPLVLLDVSGGQILEALENGVSQWPKLDSRFPQVSCCTAA